MKKAILLSVAAAMIAVAMIPRTLFAQYYPAHWELMRSDPFPDSVTQVVAGPGDLVYMATSDKGIFKSTDEGENWTQINTGIYPGGLDITMLAIGPHGDLLSRDGYGNIIYSKDDSSWSGQGVPWYWNYPGAVLSTFAFDSHGVAYAGTIGAGIYKMDSIGTWSQVMSPNIIPGVQAMRFDDQDRLIVHYDKLYRTRSDFSTVDTTWAMTSVRNTPVQLLKTTWGSILVVSDTLFELTDHLQKFTPIGDGMLVVDSTGLLNSFSNGLFQSTNHGITWQNNSGKIVHGPASYRLVEATRYGFISSGDGEPEVSVSFDTTMNFIAFRELDENLPVTIQVDPKGNLQVFDLSGSSNVHNGGIWSSSDHGNTWQRRMSKQNIQGTLMEDGKYYAPQIWPPMVSVDGLSYKPVNVPQGIKGGLYVSPNGTLWIYYGSAHFIRSLDGGATWNEFAHITDVPPAYFKSDSAYALGVVERGPYIWLATNDYIHLTSDDGQTWQIDTAHYFFNSNITGGKGSTIVTHTSGEGIHWLSPGENPDSSWLDVNGAYAQNYDGNMLQFSFSYESPSSNSTEFPQALIRESKSGEILDTICLTSDSLNFPYDQQYFIVPNMAIDSFGYVFAASNAGELPTTKAGLYRIVPTSFSSVSQHAQPEDDALDVSVLNETLTIRSSSALRDVELMDVAGRIVQRIAVPNSLTYSTNIVGIPNGVYFVKAEIAGGLAVQKVIILH